MIELEPGTDVQVIAETLANGAPHPHHGKVGVVIGVRAGLYPVRVQLAERAVQFAPAELRILPVRPGPTETDSVSPVSLRQIDTPGMY